MEITTKVFSSVISNGNSDGIKKIKNILSAFLMYQFSLMILKGIKTL
jgi:hypothetical protein